MTRPRSDPPPHRRSRYQRRASLYVAVLGTALLVTVIGVAGVLAVRVRRENVAGHRDYIAARHAARSAIDLALGGTTFYATDWRTRIQDGTWLHDLPLGTATISVIGSDPDDGDLVDDVCDRVVLIATGTVNHACVRLQVTALPDIATADPLYDELMAQTPLAYWRLNEEYSVPDEMERYWGFTRSHLTLVTSPYRCDPAVQLSGYGDYIEVPHQDDFLLADGCIQIWFQTDDVGSRQGLISKESLGYDTGGHVYLDVVNGTLEARLQSTTTSYTVSGGTVAAGAWQQAAFTWGRYGMQLFVNGQVVDYNSYTGGLGTTSGGAGNYEPWAIGANAANSGDRTTSGAGWYFKGELDEVVLFDKPLLEDDVRAIYTAGSTLPPTTLHVEPGSWRQLVD